jgi:hypothetical protein
LAHAESKRSIQETHGREQGKPLPVMGREEPATLADSEEPRLSLRVHGRREGLAGLEQGDWWTTEPALGRVAHGVAHRVDRLRAIGNGQVPRVAALAWETLRPRVR